MATGLKKALFENVSVGDRVWLSSSYGQNPKDRMEVVKKVTPTMMELEHGDRYRRENGQRVGGYSGCAWATGFAVIAEVREWDAKRAKQKQDAKDRQKADETRAAKRAELRELFSTEKTRNTNSVYVRDAEWGSSEERKGLFDVTFHGLTEQQVRELAEKLKS